MGLRPFFAHVLVEREKLASKSSLIIPNAAQKAHAKSKGKVIDKGPDASDQIEIGMTVVFGKYAGAWINSEGVSVADPDDGEFYILKDEDILCEVT